MKLFAAAMFVTRERWDGPLNIHNFDIRILAYHIEADTKEEAIGKGQVALINQYPRNAGWRDHQVYIEEIPEDVIRKHAGLHD